MTGTMTTERSTPAMSPDELRRLIDARGYTSHGAVAKVLGVHRMTVSRWLAGKVVINAPAAALIRERLSNPNK